MSGRRFLWLDGSRGVAAIIVMIYHFHQYLTTGSLFKSSYLAVDLFFMMSGFVLSHAYGRKLQAGMTFARFLAIRMIRLYPVYFAATALGFSYYAAKIVLHAADAPAAIELFDVAALNAFFIPNHDISSIPSGMFPFAPTGWSLSVEVIVSALFATVFYRMRRPTCALVAGISAACFVVFAIHYKTVDLGWEAKTFAPSLFRATAEFTAGMLIYGSVLNTPSVDAPRWRALATFGILIATMVFMPAGLFTSLATIALLFPMTIFYQASSEPTRWTAWLCHQLGRGSYAIYLLHTPVLLWGVGLVKMIAPAYAQKSEQSLGIPLIAATLVASYLCVALDEKVRTYLSSVIRRRYPVDPVNVVPVESGAVPA